MKIKKRLAIIGIGIVVISIIIGAATTLFTKHNQDSIQTPDIVTCIIRENNATWEVKVSQPNGKKYLYKNGHKQELLEALGVKDNKPCMELPIVSDNLQGLDIEKQEESQVITWDVDLQTSARYIKYLQDNGYKEIRFAATQSYIEIYMKKNAVIKRILVTNDSIMIANVLNDKLPDIKNYYKQTGGK